MDARRASRLVVAAALGAAAFGASRAAAQSREATPGATAPAATATGDAAVGGVLGVLDVPALPTPPARRVGLVEALRTASREASDARLAEVAVRRALAAERTALATLLPTVNGVVNLNVFDREVRNIAGVIRPRYGYDLDLQVQESLSLRGWNATRIAAANTRAARLRVEEAARLVRGSVARVYFAVLSARQGAVLARTQLATALRQSETVAARIAAGAAVPLDRTRAELAVLEARQRADAADAQLAQQWDLLGQSLGQDEPVDAEDAPPPAPEEPLGRYLDRALAARPDLRVLEATRDTARLQIDDAWMRYVPSLNLSWVGVYRGPTTIFNPTTTQWTALASLVVPLFDGGARYGAADDARAQLADAEERAAQLRRSVRVQVRDAYRRAETAARAIVLAEQSVALAQQNVERAGLAYAAGAATGVELDEARRQLAQAETTLLLRAVERQLALIDLLASAGML
jgi:outer membrane protein TolC